MRTIAVTLLAIALVVGAWLVTMPREHRSTALDPPSTGDAVESPDTDSIIAPRLGLTAGTADDPEPPVAPAIEATKPVGSLACETRFDGLRDFLVDDLVRSGLSRPDSEQTVDAANAELRGCATTFCTPGGSTDDTDLYACRADVLQEHGLSEAVGRVTRSIRERGPSVGDVRESR